MKKFFTLLFILLLAFALAYVPMAAKAIKATPIATHTPTATPPAQAHTPTPARLACTVTTGYSIGTVNLRACPGDNCPILAVAHEGQTLGVLSLGDWKHVTTGDLTGYIYSKFCDPKGK